MKATLNLFLLLLPPLLLQAETVERPTPLRIDPAADAPVLQTLTPGLNLARVADDSLPAGMLPLPEGWVAVVHEGTFVGYVSNRQVMKDFSVEVGAGVLLEASIDAPLLTVVEEDDVATVVGVTGDWSRISIRKPLTGYVEASALVASTAESSEEDPPEAAAEPLPAPPPPPSVTPVRNADFAPILLNGRLERTRRIFGRGPEQDYQLISGDGKVLALLEVDSLITTEPVASFLGRAVNVVGVPRKPEESRSLILRVETLRLANP